jgi:dienelactone hydrolase
MRPRATTTLTKGTTAAIAAVLAACASHVPLAPGYDGPEALPTDGPLAGLVAPDLPLGIVAATEARDRARFVVRHLAVPSVADPGTSIEFEYYDVEGDARTPVVVLLPIFSGAPAIPRFFARYFANQGWAAVVVLRTRDPFAVLVAADDTVESNLRDYGRVLDWVDQEPEIDSSRVGLFGVSLGAMDAVMLAAVDHRVDALVVAMAGGDLPYIMLNTRYRRVVRTVHDIADVSGTSREALSARLDAEIQIDPLELARYVDAERVLMIMTRTDAIIPFEAQERLRESLGSPEALRLVTGHRPSVLMFPRVRSAAFEFFARQFGFEPVALASN